MSSSPRLLRDSCGLEAIGNADAWLLAVEISSVSSDQQCVVEACGGPDDGIGKFEGKHQTSFKSRESSASAVGD